MKIKIIDLCNRIAKNKNIPKIIKYDLLEKDYQFLEYDKEEISYRFVNDREELWGGTPFHHLNDYIEIIEE